MFALPLWLTCYIGIGLAIQLLTLRVRDTRHIPTTSFGCTVAVVTFALFWPVFLAVAVKRVRHG